MLIERPKMTRTMYQALKRNIMREREKIKQGMSQTKACLFVNWKSKTFSYTSHGPCLGGGQGDMSPPMFFGVGDKRHFVPPMFYRTRFFYLVP